MRRIDMDNNNVALITKMVLEAIEHQKASEENGYLVPVGVSARHIHLTQEHVEALFGEGYQLTKRKELMGGQFASNETVTIVGLKLRAIENVRILGPVKQIAGRSFCNRCASPWRESSDPGIRKYCGIRSDRRSRTERCDLPGRGLHHRKKTYPYGAERCHGSRCA